MQELLMNAMLAHTTRRAYVSISSNLIHAQPCPLASCSTISHGIGMLLIIRRIMVNSYLRVYPCQLSSVVRYKCAHFPPILIPFVSIGPVIGAPFPPGDPAPRAVSQEYFKKVCPNTTIIDSMEVNEHLRLDDRVPALDIFEKWVEKLNSIEDPCVEIKLDSFQLFEIWQVIYAWYSRLSLS